MYDFDGDGFITREDIRLLLSYIPNLQLNDGPKSNSKDQLQSDTGNTDTPRFSNLDAIKTILDMAFEPPIIRMSMKDFITCCKERSPGMFVSVMSVLHERLPCAQFAFRQFYNFKEKLLVK